MERSAGQDRLVTRLLNDWRQGDTTAPECLLAILYDDLRALAAHSLGGPQRAATLQPTDLVHEAYMRLLGSAARGWNDRRHFISSAVRAMRSVVVDRARARMCLKRGGGQAPASAPLETPATSLDPDDVIRVHEAIARLETLDPRAASVLTLRCFGGLSLNEAALVLGVTERIARRDWEFAKRWLRSELGRDLATASGESHA